MLDKNLIIENLSLIIVIENTKAKKSHSDLIKTLSGFAKSIENGHFDIRYPKAIKYVGLAHKANKKTNTVGVFFPDFPGFVSAGNSLDEAIENAREGLIFHIEGLLKSGETLPKASTLDDIMNDQDNKKCTPFIICLEDKDA